MKIKIYRKTILSVLLALLFCAVFVSVNVINRMNIERLTMEQLIAEKSTKANEVLSRLLYKTQILSALVINNHGEVEDFEQIASTIIDDPAILNVLLAPNGVVEYVYPLQGNEAVVGLDFFQEGAGNKEAVMARDSGQLVFGGPFTAVQGWQVLVGRLPVFLEDDNGTEQFWGLVSVTLKYPEVLNGTGLNELQFQGFAYEIWRINPDDGEKQIISGSNYKHNTYTRYIEKNMSIQNADWCFRILPVRAWFEYPDTWMLVFLGLCISLLVAFVMQNNGELKDMKNRFEELSHMDSLTGIFNRRYFMELAATQVERIKRADSEAYIIMIDIDHFKQINDIYGHGVGDTVLRSITQRVKDAIRPYDIFARYGGEEFILLVTDIDKDNVQMLVERIMRCISDEPIMNEHITITASFGISRITSATDFEECINRADEALYVSKRGGRNKCTFSDAEPQEPIFNA